MNQKVLADLRTALLHAEAGADPSNRRCGVEPEHRKAMQLYLQSWVIQPLRRAIAAIVAGDRGTP
jgi:hypothetical protein